VDALVRSRDRRNVVGRGKEDFWRSRSEFPNVFLFPDHHDVTTEAAEETTEEVTEATTEVTEAATDETTETETTAVEDVTKTELLDESPNLYFSCIFN
jgi:hypothetical protein